MLHLRNHTYYNFVIDSVVLIFLFTIFYTLFLGSYPLFTPDEARYSEVAREMIVRGDYITPRVNDMIFLDKPILHYWLQTLSIHWFGVKEWALRFFPALFGIMGCLVTYLCGRILFDRRTALLASLILATTPLYFGGAHYANLDLEVAVLLGSTLLFFITAVNKEAVRKKILFAAYCSAALAFLTKGLIAIAFPVLIIGIWILLSQRRELLKKIHLFEGGLIFLFITLPWYVAVQKENPGFFYYFFIEEHVTRFLSLAAFNNKMPFWFYVPVILIGMFPWTIFLFQAIYHAIKKIYFEKNQHLVELFLFIWASVIFVFFSIPHSKIVGYILPIFPPLALLIGRYLSHLFNHPSQKINRWNSIYFIFFGLLFTSLLFILPHKNLIHFTPPFIFYLKIIAMIVMMSVFFVFLNMENLILLLVSCILCNVLLLLTLTYGAAYLNIDSIKPLLETAKNYIKPGDEIVAYFKYYYDIPLYLGRTVTVVADWNATDIMKRDNWRRELWRGMELQKTNSLLINEKIFWQHFQNKRRVFVFLSEKNFPQFKLQATHYSILGKYKDTILLANQDISPSRKD